MCSHEQTSRSPRIFANCPKHACGVDWLLYSPLGLRLQTQGRRQGPGPWRAWRVGWGGGQGFPNSRREGTGVGWGVCSALLLPLPGAGLLGRPASLPLSAQITKGGGLALGPPHRVTPGSPPSDRASHTHLGRHPPSPRGPLLGRQSWPRVAPALRPIPLATSAAGPRLPSPSSATPPRPAPVDPAGSPPPPRPT